LANDAASTADWIATLVQTLSPDFVERFIRYLKTQVTLEDVTPGRIFREVSNDAAKSQIWTLVERIKAIEPNLSPQALAFGIECALQTGMAKDSSQSVDLVWTGPDVTAPMRRSAAVLLELIHEARIDLVIISFAAFKIADALEALESAAQRNVRLYFILESEEESDGRYQQHGHSPFSSLARYSNAKFFVWPHAKRPFGALLHAKAVVADASTALITSANLSENAISSNIEIGVLVKGGDAPKRVHDHVMSLIRSGEFSEVTNQIAR
jgi:cardiolipin synthase